LALHTVDETTLIIIYDTIFLLLYGEVLRNDDKDELFKASDRCRCYKPEQALIITLLDRTVGA